MTKRKNFKKKQLKSKQNLVFYSSFLLSVLFVSCSENQAEQNKVDLPYIGHHDIAYEKTESHNVGDTLFHTIPEWAYWTEDSTVLRTEDIANKVWIVDFFFSYCPTICPPMTKAMRDVNDSLKAYQKELTFLSFSIDPDRDTPSRLKLYKERHEITADNWHFLTGDEEETHVLGIEGFQIFANADEKAPGGYAHSSNFVLVDKNQHVRGIYDGLDADSRAQLIKDAKLLLDAD